MSKGGNCHEDDKLVNKKNDWRQNFALTLIFFIFGVGLFFFYVLEWLGGKFLKLQFRQSICFVVLYFLFLIIIRGNSKRIFAVIILFVLMGIVPKLSFLFLYPNEKIKLLKETGIIGYLHYIGIMNLSWICIMGAAASLITFFRGLRILTEKPVRDMSKIYYEKNIEIITFLLGKVIDGIFLLGGALVACMGILWAGEGYNIASAASAKMLLACVLSGCGVFFGIVVPLYKRMSEILEITKDLKDI